MIKCVAGSPTRRRRQRRAVVAFVTLLLAGAPASAADEPVVRGMTWMSQYPATWNAAAPKLVSDGLHMYAVLCGIGGQQESCSVMRKRGNESWQHDAASFRSNQPALAVLDRKGRLNIFVNDPALRHLRFDHPSVDLQHFVEVPFRVGLPVGYLHASYDAVTDTLFVAFNDTSTWTLYVTTKTGDATDWTVPSALPAPDPLRSMYLYARTVRANGRYFVLAGEHPRESDNASYTAAVLFDGASPSGPWTVRVLHRATGENVGIPYSNWVIPTDLQADQHGHVRALMHIVESGSGHTPLAEGLHFAREEDEYRLRHVASSIDDGFAMQVDPSGTHWAFALMLSAPTTPVANRLAVFRSDDDGISWAGPQRIVAESALNPVPLDPRSGSMVPPNELPFIYSAPIPPPWERVMQGVIPLDLPNTSDRYEVPVPFWPGSVLRAYRDRTSDRAYRYVYRYRDDESFSVTYTYTAGTYFHVYEADSNGNVLYYNSDGARISSAR